MQGRKNVSKLNTLEQFYSSGIRNVLGCKRVHCWEMSVHYTHCTLGITLLFSLSAIN